MRYQCSGATPEVREKFNRIIQKWWSGQFGGFQVKNIVVETDKGDAFTPTIMDGKGTLGANMNGAGMWDAQSSEWTAAYEMGHGMHVDGDRYDSYTGKPDPAMKII